MFYTYLPQDFAAAAVDTTALQTLIAQSLPVEGISRLGAADSFTRVDVYFADALSEGDKTILDGIIYNYSYEAAPVVNQNIAIIRNVKPPGTNGGSFAQNTWVQRQLNTIEGSTDFASIASNQFTLQPGVYIITAKCPACNVQSHQARLKNVTDNTFVMGTNAYTTGSLMTNSDIYSQENISVAKTYQIDHICSKSVDSIGLGRATGFNSDEIYTTIIIQSL